MKKSLTLLFSLLLLSNVVLASAPPKKPHNDEGPSKKTPKKAPKVLAKPPINDEGPGKGGKK